MPNPCWTASPRERRVAFTLIELLAAMTVLVLLITVIAQMTSGVSSIVGRGEAHIDTDTQARALLDRMAIDFGAMVKRSDVDYYLKGRPADGTLTQPGNDQIAFYSEVPGYFPTTAGTAAQSSASLVAYRVNTATMHLERLCKGLAWNGASAGNALMMGFLPVPLASPLPSPLPTPTPTSFPTPVWKAAAYPTESDPTKPDLDWEEMGPQVFRFEYYYVLKGQQGQVPATSLTTLSIVPWNTTAPATHTSVNGMQDVAGIGVIIAVIDQKSRLLVTNAQLTTLAGQMEDAPGDQAAGTASFTSPGDIEQNWLTAVNTAANASALPRSAAAAIRIYTRCFYLNGVSP